jgi:hypothetical protein
METDKIRPTTENIMKLVYVSLLRSVALKRDRLQEVANLHKTLLKLSIVTVIQQCPLRKISAYFSERGQWQICCCFANFCFLLLLEYSPILQNHIPILVNVSLPNCCQRALANNFPCQVQYLCLMHNV